MTTHLHEFTPPDSWLKCPEKRELMRLAAVSALLHSNGGICLFASARSWAQHWASMPVLQQPLSTDAPQIFGCQGVAP